MKARVYIRLAKNRGGRKAYKVEARVNPTAAPLEQSGALLPTVMFALDLEVPDSAFKQAEQVVAEINLPESAFEIAADVKVVE